MQKKTIANPPAGNLLNTQQFFRSPYFIFNPQFSDETAECKVISDDIYSMLLTQQKFSRITTKWLRDTKLHDEVIPALTADSKKEVDNGISKAVQSGAMEPISSKDFGFMYPQSSQDPDGRIWEVFYFNFSQNVQL